MSHTNFPNDYFGNKTGEGFFRSMLVNSGGVGDGRNLPPENNIPLYMTLLSNMRIQSYNWDVLGNRVDEEELRVIEEILLRRGWAILVKPKVVINGNIIQLNKFKVFEGATRFFNNRTRMPISVNLLNVPNNVFDDLGFSLHTIYEPNEFVVLNDFHNCSNLNVPFIRVVWDYANKLWEIDKSIEMQNKKLQMPIIARTRDEKAHNNLKMVAEGVSNNAIFSYVDNRSVGEHDELFTEFKFDYHLNQLYQQRADIFDDYARIIGISTAERENATYVSADVQMQAQGFSKYLSELGLINRRRGIQAAEECFGIKLHCECSVEQYVQPKIQNIMERGVHSGNTIHQ